MTVPSQERVLSIKELTRYIKMKLESDSVLQDVWIRGEISNFTKHSSGHLYFTLKDADSRVKSIMFASQAQRLIFFPREGLKVMAKGSISLYERDGQYQFYVTQMQPDGIGSLYLAFEELKKKLAAEGLFSEDLKKSLPRYPKAIGVITSPTGAAVRDIVITLQRRYPSASILLYPVLVQGTQAAASIAKAIQTMNALAEVDVLIVGRGGGSLEELWPFNEEIVARSIHASIIPVISAVGHETDFTIADLAADVRAATPTAAAELAVPHQQELKQRVAYYSQGIKKLMFNLLKKNQDKYTRLARSPYLLFPHKQLIQPTERLDRLNDQLKYKMINHLHRANGKWTKIDKALSGYNPKEQLLYARKRVHGLNRQLTVSVQGVYKDHRNMFMSCLKQLDALSPLKVMQRGYSLVYDEKQKKLINSIMQLQLGDVVKIQLTDGQADCQVWGMKGEEVIHGTEQGTDKPKL